VDVVSDFTQEVSTRTVAISNAMDAVLKAVTDESGYRSRFATCHCVGTHPLRFFDKELPGGACHR
jgi:hypothetical protein